MIPLTPVDSHNNMSMSQKGILLAAVAAALGLLVGGFIGHFGTKTGPPLSDEDHKKLSVMKKLLVDKWDSEADLVPTILDMVNRTNIRNDLMELTREPHLAATKRDEGLAVMIQKRFEEAGFDTSKLVPYRVLLTMPDRDNPNLITIHDIEDKVVFQSNYMEVPMHPDDQHENFIHAFNGYSPSGDIKTDPGIGVIYVNYGRVEDFEKLEELGIDVSGHITMARYGQIFRGNKLLHAHQRGAKGMIIFSDPEDVAWEGVQEENLYPNTFWLPGTGMQRGSTYIWSGDPLTPGWPSTEHAYRLEEEEADLPKIPCQPIGYNDAREILEKMGGLAPPKEWVGGLKNISYSLGPRMKEEFSDYRLRLQTHNTNQIMRSYNVIGTIRGEIEPDRYVLMGNHRDAWGYGAADPSSGTASLLETARVLGELLKEGWRPRRTLVLCSWGAEEPMVIGSTEWVQEQLDKLQERSVLYVNTDTCASGPILSIPASPLLWDAVRDILNMVPGVREGKTIYDEMKAYHALRNKSDVEMKTLGGGSDHVPFAFYCGIPSVDIMFRIDQNKYPVSDAYPLYHTGYETFHMMDKIVDPGFRIIQGCSRVALLTLKYFGDSAIIPYSLERLPEAIRDSLKAIRQNGNRDILMTIYDKYVILEEAVDNFTEATSEFVKKLKDVESEAYQYDPMMIRAINDQVMKLEQVFILPGGLPNRIEIRHAIFAPSQFDTYATSGFPGIGDLLYKRDELSPMEKLLRDKEIKRHISDLTILVQRATSLLEDFHFI